MPPVAPTLGARGEGNGKQGRVGGKQDMDGEPLGQVCPPLAQGTIPTIDSPQPDDKRGIKDIPRLWGHL